SIDESDFDSALQWQTEFIRNSALIFGRETPPSALTWFSQTARRSFPCRSRSAGSISQQDRHVGSSFHFCCALGLHERNQCPNVATDAERIAIARATRGRFGRIREQRRARFGFCE